MENKKQRSIIRIILLFSVISTIWACSKSSNYIKGDAKVRVFNVASTDTTQLFFLNGAALGTQTVYGTNSSYIVVAGDSTYTVSARDFNLEKDSVSLPGQTFKLGKNYSVYFTKTKDKRENQLLVTLDDVKTILDSAKLTFYNLGYTLGANVLISDAGKAFADFELKYGESAFRKVKVNKNTKISFSLTAPSPTNPAPEIKSLDSTVITNNKVYTVVLDGTKVGDLHRIITSSN
ncbi:hypothetical protein [Pedobacter sp. MW01-1-1]|uniref:hypothetical protein n=1 Tax=Pedobacter sp. MW01-1-1 TaxID=3383027 RepID=UPI003FF0754A